MNGAMADDDTRVSRLSNNRTITMGVSHQRFSRSRKTRKSFTRGVRDSSRAAFSSSLTGFSSTAPPSNGRRPSRLAEITAESFARRLGGPVAFAGGVPADAEGVPAGQPEE